MGKKDGKSQKIAARVAQWGGGAAVIQGRRGNGANVANRANGLR